MKLVNSSLFFLCVLCVLCVLCGNFFAQDWKMVADGVEHAQARREFSGKPVDINLLRLDLKKVRLDVHHAFDKAIGLETTSSIAKRKGAIAAINAGFFRLDNSEFAGDASNLLKIDGIVLSESKIGRVTLTIRNQRAETKAAINTLLPVSCTIFEKGSDGYIAEGINREIKSDEAVLYTPNFGQSVGLKNETIRIVVRKGRIVRVSEENNENLLIPRNGFVVLAHGSLRDLFRDLYKSRNIISYGCVMLADRDPQLGPTPLVRQFWNAEDAVAGVPQLIKNGKIDITWEQEKASRSFVEMRHPRTAVAKLKDGKFLMLTADGRSEQSAGLDLYDLAKYMLELGAIDAMNLDGGGSTTMFLDGKVVNKPSDKEGERKIGDAIVVTLRRKRDR